MYYPSNPMQRVREAVAESGVSPAMVIAGVVILTLFLVWALYHALRRGTSTTQLTSGTLSLAQTSTIAGSRLPNVGSEFGISFWVYINTLPMRSEASPIIRCNGVDVFAFDRNRSNVLVNFPTTTAQSGSLASFDHVSTRRWVHLMAVHVDGTIMLFKDGELYSVNRLPDSIVVKEVSGIMQIGGKPCDAYISSIAMLKRSPSYNQVKSMYRSGPRTGSNWILSSLGFDNVGLRSPVYYIQKQ